MTLNFTLTKLSLPLIILILFPLSTAHIDAQNSPNWGHIANSTHQNQLTKGIFFFPGPPNPPVIPWYSRTPLNYDQFLWRDQADVDALFTQMTTAGANVIKLSWWGEDTCDCTNNPCSCRWSPTINTTAVNHQVFTTASQHHLLVAPVLEVSPDFKFWDEYPYIDQYPNFKNRILSVLREYGNHDSWLTLYDKYGQPKKVIWLIETIHISPVDEAAFAHNFDVLAQEIFQETGQSIGFVIDPTALPPNQEPYGPNPAQLAHTNSLLAVNPFNITSDGSTEAQRLAGAESILQKWHQSQLPLMAPILPSHDDHLVPGRTPQIYGDNPQWRQSVLDLALKYQTVGITLDIWNGFSEGYVFVPTVEVPEANFQLAKTAFNQINSLSCPSDINADGTTNLSDFLILRANFLKSPLTDVRADINKDGQVNLSDFLIFRAHFLTTCT